MVGNDVIDLGDPEARPGGCHARFDARVFAAGERAALARSELPVRLRWILWAAKEAAFKVAKKNDRDTVFSPSRFVVSLTDGGPARVAYGVERYTVDLDVGARFVHAIASHASRPLVGLVSGVERLSFGSTTCPAMAVRILAISRLAPRLGIDSSELCVARDGRIPRLRHGDAELAVDLSLSHHGRFVAFACTLPASLDELRATS